MPATGAGEDTVADGFHLLQRWLILPIQPSALIAAAWQGVQAQAERQGVTSVPALPALTGDADADLATFNDAYSGLLSSHSGLDGSSLAQAALTSMGDAVNDCHTAYVTSGEWVSIQDELAGDAQVPRLPLTFQLAPPYLIETVVPGSDADQQGVRPGDAIVSSDGVSLDAVPLSRRKFLTFGDAGSTAQLGIQTPAGQRRTVTLMRTDVDEAPVSTRLYGSVGYIRLAAFSKDLSAQLDQALSTLQAEGAQGYVIDVRGNLGGYLDPVIDLLRRFIPSGVLATTTELDGRSENYTATGSTLSGPPPLAVLIDGGSLSASEVFAAAIQEYGAGELVGTPAPGCLEGSGFFDLPGGASMQITAETVTVGPQHADINTTGVQPDADLPLTPDELAGGQDPQLDRAVADVAAQIGP